MKFKSMVVCSVALALAAGMLAAPAANAQDTTTDTKTVSLVPFKDPWLSSKPRWWDIENRQFNGFLNNNPTFVYKQGQATITYQTNPKDSYGNPLPYFVGEVKAVGLKPNFWYQVKLIGKPTLGEPGKAAWGAFGDDVTNERIGYAARWWCDTAHGTATNFDDAHFEDFHKYSPTDAERHNMYGYLYMSGFLTDEYGNYSGPVNSSRSYHVTWKGSQNGPKDVYIGAWKLFSKSGYGYGSPFQSKFSTSLYYEYERGYSSNVVPRYSDSIRLPAGDYHCRLLLLEESFHNNANTYPNGGYWQGVLASEDFSYGTDGKFLSPDTNVENDVRFTIGAYSGPATPALLSAVTGSRKVILSWTASETASSYTIWRARAGYDYSILKTGVTGTSYTDTNVTNGVTYSYRVVAVDRIGESFPSNEVIATPSR